LLRAKEAEVAVVSDSQLIKQSWPILYWTVDAFRAAVEGLSPSEREEAVVQRKASFSSEALGSALSELADDARSCAILQAQTGASPADSLDHYARTTSAASAGPSAEIALRRGLVEHEARLAALLRFGADVARSSGWPEAADWTSEASTHLAAAQEDSVALAELGWPLYAKALPRPEPRVVAYLPHPDQEWVSALSKMRETFARWRGGVFTFYPLGRLATEPDSVLSYLDASEFMGDLAGTSAQRDRAFARRLGAGRQRGPWLDHLSRQLLDLRSLLAGTLESTQRGALVADRLRARLQSLDARLVHILATLPKPPADACSRWSADASLFVALARRAGDRETAEQIERISRRR
jgi:hypothetical protein